MAKILYIEDDKGSRMLVKQLLELEGHTVILSQTGKEGIADALSQVPDLILLDLNMPKTDGLSVARTLRQSPHLGNLKIVVVTAHAVTGIEETVKHAGADGCITKPISVDRFSAQIEEFLQAQPEG